MTFDIAIEALVRRIPQNWKVLPFRRLASLVGSVNSNSSATLLSLSSTGILASRQELDGLGRQAPSSETVERYWLTRPGDLVVNPMWLVGGGIGVSRLAGAVSPDYRVYQLGPDLHPRYVHHLLRSQPYRDQYRLYMRADTTFDRRVSKVDFHAMPILVPPIDEQQCIADFLDAEVKRIDNLAATQGKVRAVLVERRAAEVFNAVVGRGARDRRLSSIAWVESIPDAWREAKLGHYARMGSGHTPSRSRSEWWENCTIPWITTGEVKQVRDDRQELLHETRERISEIGLANSAAEIHPAGTVVLCRTASAGYSAVMGRDMATSQDFVTWTCGPQLDPYYLLWCLRAMRPDLLGRLAMGSTHKTIYVPDLQMLRIPLPPLAEQISIVKSIRAGNETIDAAVDVIDRQLILLNERRQALITSAVTGQIDVTTARGLSKVDGVAI